MKYKINIFLVKIIRPIEDARFDSSISGINRKI